jgi:glycosyltransferase involved in cell wall biosynthesis
MQPLFPSKQTEFATEAPGAACARLLVLVPAYNPGRILVETVRELLVFHPDVWLLVDGSTDGSDAGLELLFGGHPGFRLLRRANNLGKGATLIWGAQMAAKEKFTHILAFDSDGQHPPERVPDFRTLCQRNPDALIMGEPRFGPDAPVERVCFRFFVNTLVFVETFGRVRFDSLFGMRVYPLQSFLAVFAETDRGLRYDFETEIAVRLGWAAVPVVGVEVPVRYPRPAEGGVSHYRYLQDNLFLAWVHARLVLEALRRFFGGGAVPGAK